MASVELVSATAAVLSLLVSALSALAAFRSAESARSAQRAVEESERRSALFNATRTASEIQVQWQRVKAISQQAAIAYDTLSIFSGSHQNSGIEQSKAKVAELAAQAETHAAYARLFNNASAKLRDVPLEEIDRVQMKLATSQFAVIALREELDQITATVEARNAEYRECVLSRKP